MTNRTNISAEIALRHDMKQSEAAKIFDFVFDQISAGLAAGQEVDVPGFGRFKLLQRKGGPGRNPRTGKALTLAASTRAALHMHKALRDALNPKPLVGGARISRQRRQA